MSATLSDSFENCGVFDFGMSFRVSSIRFMNRTRRKDSVWFSNFEIHEISFKKLFSDFSISEWSRQLCIVCMRWLNDARAQLGSRRALWIVRGNDELYESFARKQG